MAALLDVLNVERVAVVGVSDGGPAAPQFALRHPERCTALILWSAVTQKIDDERSLLLKVFPLTDFIVWAAIQTQEPAMQRRAANDPIGAAMMRELGKSIVPFARRKAGKENDGTQDAALPTWPLREIRCPTLVLHGARDSAVPFSHAEFAHAQIRGSRLLRFEGGHLVGFTKHREFAEAMKAFLAEPETSTAAATGSSTGTTTTRRGSRWSPRHYLRCSGLGAPTTTTTTRRGERAQRASPRDWRAARKTGARQRRRHSSGRRPAKSGEELGHAERRNRWAERPDDLTQSEPDCRGIAVPESHAFVGLWLAKNFEAVLPHVYDPVLGDAGLGVEAGLEAVERERRIGDLDDQDRGRGVLVPVVAEGAFHHAHVGLRLVGRRRGPGATERAHRTPLGTPRARLPPPRGSPSRVGTSAEAPC